MNYEVILSARFKRVFKRLSKRHHSLRVELEKLIDSLETNPTQGTSLGQRCYKICMAIRSKGAEKSGGARVVTYVVTEDERVVLLTIYDKSEKADLEPGELDALLGGIGQ